jgi:quinol monooxygenase YgiN
MSNRKTLLLPLLFMVTLLSILCATPATAQQPSQITRLAKLVIDSLQLDAYKAALKEEIETSLRVEPGVITLYAVIEKERPTHITILEIYADAKAYKAHLLTPHFVKYRNGTKQMVKSLELVATTPLIPGLKVQ